MAMTDGKGASKPSSAQDQRVEIDGRFVREQANTAMRQFFRPITAPFQLATRQTFFNREDAVKAAQRTSKAHPDRKR
jgi:hypothetical protein